jgi:hypothetical protein
MGPRVPSPCSLEAEEAAGAQGFVVGHAAEPVAQGVEAVGRVADAEGLDAFGGEAAAGQVFAGHGAFGAAQLLFKPGGGGFVQFQELGALARSGGLFRRGELALGQRNAALLATMRTASGKVTFSILATKLKTSPEAWQPKQW